MQQTRMEVVHVNLSPLKGCLDPQMEVRKGRVRQTLHLHCESEAICNLEEQQLEFLLSSL